MQAGGIEKRKYKRLLLAAADTVNAWVMKNTASKAVIQTKILNISEGGLGLASAKNPSHTLSKNEWLKLIYFEGRLDLSFLIGTTMQVRWLLNESMLDHVCFGCEFKDLSSANAETIRKIVTGGA